MKIIIPMSGIGKRFIDAGYNEPKPLIIVEGKPIIEHIVNLFSSEDDFVFICNDLHLRETNMKEILLSIVPNCKIYEVPVDNRRGPVDAVMQVSEKEINDNDKDIIISYCDYGTEWNYLKFKNEIKKFNLDGCIACYKGFHPHMLNGDNYAFVKEDDKNFLEIQEKKSYTDNKMNEYASNGTYYFKSGSIIKKYFQELIDKNIEINGEFYVSMVYNLMKHDNLKIRVFEITKMLQWGTPKDLEEYLNWSNYFLNRIPNFNKKFIDDTETTLILPMAGAGSRFFNNGYITPKPLLNIDNYPMIIQAIDCLPETTNKIFICNLEHIEKYKVKETLLQYYPKSVILAINFITEGQASSCNLAFEHCDIDLYKPVLISACDNGVYYNIDKYNEMINDDTIDIIIWSFSNNPTSQLYPHMYAWLDVDENNYIKRVSIKKPFDDCENKHAIIGTMYFKKGYYFLEGLKHIYENNCRTNGEFYVDNMIEPLVNMGYKCKIFNVDNYLCWGTPNDYKTYNYWNEYFL